MPDLGRPNAESTVPAGDDGRSGFLVGDWHVEPSIRRIRCGGKVVKLEPRVMQVLEFLARHPNEVVSRTQLEKGVWGERTVGYEALGRTVALLRRALGDDSRQPKYIETLSKKGYRLIASVRHPEDNSSSVHNKLNMRPVRSGFHLKGRPTAVAAIVLTVTVIFAAGWLWRVPQEKVEPRLSNASMPVSIVVLPFNNLSSDPNQSYVAPSLIVSLACSIHVVPE